MKITFEKLHGETEWLLKPIKDDGTRLTDTEIDALVTRLNDEADVGDGNSPLDLRPN
jgi:hypothetical protein